MNIYVAEALRAGDEHPDVKRFRSKVDTSGDCWLWLGTHDRKGYGRFAIGAWRDAQGKRRNNLVGAHRFAYELENGPIPKGPGYHGFCVLHRCDNPRCVRPAHLFIGTNADNVRDMDSKGRRVCTPCRGEQHGRAVLDEAMVRAIFERHHHGGIPRRQLAHENGVSLSTISHIVIGRQWAHLGLVESAPPLWFTAPFGLAYIYLGTGPWVTGAVIVLFSAWFAWDKFAYWGSR